MCIYMYSDMGQKLSYYMLVYIYMVGGSTPRRTSVTHAYVFLYREMVEEISTVYPYVANNSLSLVGLCSKKAL